MNKLRISYKSNNDGVKCSVEVNGEEMANKIQELTLEMSADRIPVITLKMPADEIEAETPYETGNTPWEDTWERIKEITNKVSEEISRKIKAGINPEKHGEVDEE